MKSSNQCLLKYKNKINIGTQLRFFCRGRMSFDASLPLTGLSFILHTCSVILETKSLAAVCLSFGMESVFDTSVFVSMGGPWNADLG